MEAEFSPGSIEHDHGNHDLCDADVCFTAKMRYMRANGGLSISVPAGWGGPSWMSQERGVIAEAQANGYEPERVK